MPQKRKKLPTTDTRLRNTINTLQSKVYKYIKELSKVYSVTVGTDLRAGLKDLNVAFTKAYLTYDKGEKTKYIMDMIVALEYMACVTNASTNDGATHASVEDLLTSMLDAFEQTEKWGKYNASRDGVSIGENPTVPNVQELDGYIPEGLDQLEG